MSGAGGLEGIVNNSPVQKKHSDKYYLNKEILIGEVTAFGGALAFGFGFSYLINSKEALSALGTIGSSVGYFIGYVSSAYIDRRKDFANFNGFCRYLLTVCAKVGLPASIAYHAAHFGATYCFQNLGISAGISAAIAHLPAILVGVLIANIFGKITGVVKSENEDYKNKNIS